MSYKSSVVFRLQYTGTKPRDEFTLDQKVKRVIGSDSWFYTPFWMENLNLFRPSLTDSEQIIQIIVTCDWNRFQIFQVLKFILPIDKNKIK